MQNILSSFEYCLFTSQKGSGGDYVSRTILFLKKTVDSDISKLSILLFKKEGFYKDRSHKPRKSFLDINTFGVKGML